MVNPDPSLGLSAAFPTQTVRNALLFAMQMGKPNDATRQVKFLRRTGTVTYTKNGVEIPIADVRRDRDGKPLDPEVSIVRVPDEPISVDVAIELSEASADEIPVGNFRPVKATVTMMEAEYQLITGCRELMYNADRYGFAYELDATGLFDLTFHTLIFFALNES